MSHPISDHTPHPTGPGTRALIGEAAAREADTAWLRARLSLQVTRIARFLMWMDEAGIPRDQCTAEWFEAVAPSLPQCQIAPKAKSRSNEERNWTRLLADVLYAEQQGCKGPERFNFVKSQPGFRDRHYQSKEALEIRLSEARNKSLIGRMIKAVEREHGAEARAHLEVALIEACSAARLQTVVTDFK